MTDQARVKLVFFSFAEFGLSACVQRCTDSVFSSSVQARNWFLVSAVLDCYESEWSRQR